jgi:hypothetical protein
MGEVRRKSGTRNYEVFFFCVLFSAPLRLCGESGPPVDFVQIRSVSCSSVSMSWLTPFSTAWFGLAPFNLVSPAGREMARRFMPA